MAAVQGFAHTFSQDVAFRDLDGLGHVNNAVYLSYVESARLAYMQEVLGPLELEELGIVADVKISFRSPAALGETLEVGHAHQPRRGDEPRLRLRGAGRRRTTGRRGVDRARSLRLRRAAPGARPRGVAPPNRVPRSKEPGQLMPTVFEKTVLPNGLRAVTAPMPQAKSVACFVMLAAGSRYETRETNGIAHFAEHMFFKGTERRPTARDIAGEIDSIGGEFNAFTGKEYTGYYVKCAAEHRDTALDVLVDMLRNSKFDPEEIEREKGVIVEEMNMYYDTPRDYLEGVYDELLYDDTPLGWDIIGKKETVRSAERETFLDYLDRWYRAPRMVAGIAGAVGDDIVPRLEELLGDVPNAREGLAPAGRVGSRTGPRSRCTRSSPTRHISGSGSTATRSTIRTGTPSACLRLCWGAACRHGSSRR